MRTRSVSDVSLFGFLPPSSALSPRVVAMLNGRETLREELPTKFFVASGLGSRNHADPENISYVLREGPDGGYNATEVPPSWMNTVNGKNSADALRIAQIQVDQKVMVSNI